ncbi:response regulator [Marinithermus hydrothermalis]|uniref:Response regulator receiver protein n=1 Tax=Marinithermus hydrothermalis (strain DSM 14884 / JCM 11576 / T1) TaxID=869210 RepID=F2NMM0_MARHT|nr:response regulator [Marinithermus hydrothermalis]AEB12190.1 response regulator receiver protein [Marinithermus hydrothermalis DSM 14884]
MGKRVLLVDDEPFVGHLVRNLLVRDGYEVLVARNGREALDCLERGTEVHLIITDLAMPELDGFGLLEALRGKSVPPVLVLTARGHVEDERRALDLGAAGLITKPFSREGLLAAVRMHLEGSS